MSSYDASDLLGNLWFVDNGSGQQSYYQDTSGFGFGTGYGIAGSNPSGFGYGGANGCQTDADTGLVLMGHRYYDPRTGRFISQDPAGDGDNWYAYCGNDPMDGVDPSGLDTLSKTDLFWMMYTSGDYNGGDYHYFSSGGIYWTNADGTGGSISHGIDIPSSGPNLGVGGLVDDWMTFSAVQRAGQVAGDYDSGKASRGAAIGAGALAVGAVVAVAATRGEDSEAGAESKIGGWITKDVYSKLEQDVGKVTARKFEQALQKGLVPPKGNIGIKRLAQPIGDYTHELKIGGSGYRILGTLGEWNGEAKYIMSLLTGHQ